MHRVIRCYILIYRNKAGTIQKRRSRDEQNKSGPYRDAGIRSTVGVILAKVIGYDFIDTDILIQKAEKKRLSRIIEEIGVDGFLEVENRVNASVEADHCVIATGGSAVYGEEAMRHFKKIGHIMYLKTDFETISRRLKNIKKRGVALKEGQTLRDLYDERVVKILTILDKG